jgi:hypothetical protein
MKAIEREIRIEDELNKLGLFNNKKKKKSKKQAQNAYYTKQS